ncbi:MAG: GNAT family N-acetyltransferase [Hamadaea sp.]|nr:GNAT family N-acetyltransferase [Hamadaea sp.]NUT05894.1 GNAT family N-acetyltransferase [Hamadaea sp.]
MSSLTIREVSADADYEAWRSVRLAVYPYERTATLEELKSRASAERQLFVVERDGVLVAAGGLIPSSIGGTGSVAPWVLPEYRRQGIGAEVLAYLVGEARRRGFPAASGNADDAGSAAFAERYGFVEVDRQVEQVRAVGDEPAPVAPLGVSLVTVAERPELWREAYEPLGLPGIADMAVSAPMKVTLPEWEDEWLGEPSATFIAIDDATGDLIGTAGLILDTDQTDRAENAFTTVRRDWRGRGVASAVKRATLHWAATRGLREIYTWTQRGNADMRRLNEHLGYVTRTISVRLEQPL